VLIRTRVAEIREMGRATQGVTLINLDADEKLAGLEKVIESEESVAGEIAAGESAAAASAPEAGDASSADTGVDDLGGDAGGDEGGEGGEPSGGPEEQQ
jgi:DNA gyrase subunit A